MARQRFIWPDIWDDPVLGRLSDSELLFYIGCFSNADDEGRLLGDPAFLRSTIFPYRELSATKVKNLRDRLASKVNSFRVYQRDGVDYIAFTNWDEWQKPKYPKPSKLPPPPTQDSPNASESLGEGSSMGWVGLGWEGLDRDKQDKLASPPALFLQRLIERAA